MNNNRYILICSPEKYQTLRRGYGRELRRQRRQRVLSELMQGIEYKAFIILAIISAVIAIIMLLNTFVFSVLAVDAVDVVPPKSVTASPSIPKPEKIIKSAVESEKTGQAYTLTSAERDLIERVVMAEARGEPYEGQIAVAQVIRDRSEIWNKSIKKVLTAPWQFAAPYKGKVSESVKLAVFAVFDNGDRAFKETTTHFYAYKLCRPAWAEDKAELGVIGGHRFMR